MKATAALARAPRTTVRTTPESISVRIAAMVAIDGWSTQATSWPVTRLISAIGTKEPTG